MAKNMICLAGALLAVTLAQAQSNWPPTMAGVHAFDPIRSNEWPTIRKRLYEIQPSWARVYLRWREVETSPGVYNWTTARRLIANAPVNLYVVTLEQSRPAYVTDADWLPAWERYVTAFGTEFASQATNIIVQIFNEPWYPSGWFPPSVNNWRTLCDHVTAAAVICDQRLRTRGYRVLGRNFQTPYLGFEDVHLSTNGYTRLVDYIGTHLYMMGDVKDGVDPALPWAGYGGLNQAQALQRLQTLYQKPLICTEAGFRETMVSGRLERVTNTVRDFRAAGGILINMQNIYHGGGDLPTTPAVPHSNQGGYSRTPPGGDWTQQTLLPKTRAFLDACKLPVPLPAAPTGVKVE